MQVDYSDFDVLYEIDVESEKNYVASQIDEVKVKLNNLDNFIL